MSVHVQKAVKMLNRNVARYSPRVIRKLSKRGETADAAVVYSAAKYYPVLKKLASE